MGQRTWRAVEPAREPSYSPVPLAVVEAAESPKQCNAREIRAAVKRSFAGRFKMKQVNAKQGNWRYPGEFQNRLFTLTLDWNWMGGPRYGLVIGRHNLDYSAPPFAWETLLGFGTGSWDFLCEHNLADSIELLGQIIETAVTLLPNTLSNYPGGKVV